jgi:hypothetical protein
MLVSKNSLTLHLFPKLNKRDPIPFAINCNFSEISFCIEFSIINSYQNKGTLYWYVHPDEIFTIIWVLKPGNY